MTTDGQIQATGDSRGWRLIEGDPGAPADGHCWLANEQMNIAWESWSGVSYQPLSDTVPHYWKLDHRDG